MTIQNTQKHVLITGCSTGIGQYLALHLKEHGFNVLATCRNPHDVKSLSEKGIRCHTLDLANETSIEQGFDWAMNEAGGQLYGLINNGAYGQPGAVEDLPTQALREQFEVNLFGTHSLTTKAVAAMRAENQGRIVQISSILGLICLPYRGAYNASKYALEALSDTLRLELKATPIKVVLVEPGAIESQFRANALIQFNRHIKIDNSAHQSAYQQQIQRLTRETNALGPQAVQKQVLKALLLKNPAYRYQVTKEAIIMSKAKRFLPDRLIDWILSRAPA